jgi:hypothetical protein
MQPSCIVTSMNSSFFVSGVPCTGKTWLGNWLQENEGFHHVDAEKDNGRDLDTFGIHKEWDMVAQTGRAEAIATKISTLSNPVILNWGFPMSYMYFVRALQVAGMPAWWIRADPRQARVAFTARGSSDVQRFDHQIGAINQNLLLIELVFGERIIEGLTANGAQRHPSDLWLEIKLREQGACTQPSAAKDPSDE